MVSSIESSCCRLSCPCCQDISRSDVATSQKPSQNPSKIESTNGRCRRDISLVSNAPIYPGFRPQNITVIMSQESHHQHAFFDQNCRNHFPHALETET